MESKYNRDMIPILHLKKCLKISPLKGKHYFLQSIHPTELYANLFLCLSLTDHSIFFCKRPYICNSKINTHGTFTFIDKYRAVRN